MPYQEGNFQPTTINFEVPREPLDQTLSFFQLLWLLVNKTPLLGAEIGLFVGAVVVGVLMSVRAVRLYGKRLAYAAQERAFYRQ